MRNLVLLLMTLCASPLTAHAQTQQQAVNRIQRAIDTQSYWAGHVANVQNAIDAIPAGPQKQAVQAAWTSFWNAWSSANTAAGSQIDAAMDDLEAGEWAAAIAHADDAVLQMGLLAFHYEFFTWQCLMAGWAPPSLP